MKRRTITKRGVDALKRGGSISDDQVRGFIARRLPSNVATFGFRYVERTTGKRRWLPLGLYGRITVEEARRLAQKAAGDVAMGDDPLQERLDERKASRSEPSQTVNDVLDRFLNEYVDKKLRTKAEMRRAIDHWVRPAIGKRPINEVSRKDIIEMCDGIAAKVSLRRADMILAYIRKAFNWWSIQGNAEFKSPLVPGMARLKPTELMRQRVLTPAELRDVWAALQFVHPAFSAILRALTFSALRRDEMANLQYSEIIDDDVIVIPGERMKTGKPHAVPLTPELRKIIESRGKPKNAAFVFWARKGGSRPFQGWSRQKILLDKHINRIRAARGDREMPAWRLHDLRRTARTWMGRAGVDKDIAELILAHAKESVRAAYDLGEYVDQKRDGLLRLEAYILKILSKPAS